MTTILSSLTSITTEVLARRKDGCVPIVAIDGRGGAGKSTLARDIVRAIPGAAHIEYDWFHLMQHEVTAYSRFDHKRLIQEVIEPFNCNSRSISFLRYNWGYLTGIEEGFHSEPVSILDAKFLVIEGCNTIQKDLMPYYGVTIWVDTSPQESLQRGIRRDIEEYQLDPSRVQNCWAEWVTREENELTIDNRRMKADILYKF